MTVEKVRKLLGNEIKHLTDQQVEELIKYSSALIEVVLDIFNKNKNERKKQILDTN